MGKKYKAFTLVELILVIGIIIILVAIGISVARYAILKAQDTHHKDAVRNLYAFLLLYKNDNGMYPGIGNCKGCIEKEFFSFALGFNGTEKDHLLKPYVDSAGGFDGGSSATYYYAVDEVQRQFVLVCVSLGGIDDESERGFYCEGSGLGLLPEGEGAIYGPVSKKDVDSQDPHAISIKSLNDTDWDPKQGGFWLTSK